MSAVEEVAESVIRIVEEDEGRLNCMYLLMGSEQRMLIDTGLATTPRRTLSPALERLNVDVATLDLILVTHADIDHSGGLGSLQRMAPKARAICGRGDKLLVEDVNTMIDRRYRQFRSDHDIDQGEEFVSWVISNDSSGRINEVIDRDKQTIQLGEDWYVELLRVPGHSAGHLSVYDRRSEALIIGDAVLGSAVPFADGSGAFAPTYREVDDYLETIERLRACNADLMLTAHYPIMRGASVNRFCMESMGFAALLERAVLRWLEDRGESTTEAIVRAAADVVRNWPAESDMTLAYPVVGHLESLDRRGLVSRRDGRPARWTVVA